MNIWNKTKLFFSNLFQGLAVADDVIQGYSDDDGSVTSGVHQVKDTQRVAPALLRGEVTKEVAELRYRDYLVSEGSRQFENDMDLELEYSIKTLPKITAVNHEITAGMVESMDDEGNFNNQTSYTLKFNYQGNVKFLLEKYCDNFSIDNDKIILRFNLLPNRNVVTSKAFCNYLQKELLRKDFGGEYSKIDEMWFVSYKITLIPNYIKFTFKDLVLSGVTFDDKKQECILEYHFNYYNIEDLTKKYVDEELKKKYSNKEQKHISQEISVSNMNLKCEICGSPILKESEGLMNKEICGKFCCTECICKELLKQKENENSN